MLSCRVSQRDNFGIFVVARRATGEAFHGDLLLRNWAPSFRLHAPCERLRFSLSAPALSYNSSECLAHSSLRIVRLLTCLRAPSHSFVPPQGFASAHSRHLAKASPSNGLVRKQIAPAFIARARVISTGKAVMKMKGTQ